MKQGLPTPDSLAGLGSVGGASTTRLATAIGWAGARLPTATAGSGGLLTRSTRAGRAAGARVATLAAPVAAGAGPTAATSLSLAHTVSLAGTVTSTIAVFRTGRHGGPALK
jgi:hypothetical protein